MLMVLTRVFGKEKKRKGGGIVKVIATFPPKIIANKPETHLTLLSPNFNCNTLKSNMYNYKSNLSNTLT